jgi:hypothetical protein
MSGIRWTAVPAKRLRGSELSWRVNAVLILVTLAALAGPLALLLSSRTAPPALQEHRVDAVAALAERVAIDFLSGQYTQVPVAVGVDPTFGAPRSVSGQIDPDYLRPVLSQVASTQVIAREYRIYGERRYELVTVAVFGSDGLAWQVAVPVYLDGPVLAAAPTLLPPPRHPATPLPALDYRGDIDQVTPPSNVVPLVAEWATAWASDDRATLKRLTGDVDPGIYRGLGGFVAERTVLVSAVAIDRVSQSGVPRRLVVRVTVWVRPEGANVSGQSVELDLLVEDASTDLPKISAWGPAGSTPMVEFANREPAS